MKRRKQESCREEIRAAARQLGDQHPEGTFSMQQVIDVMRARGTQHLDLTIRRHISTFMCVNAVGPHAGLYPDLEWVARGRYRLVPSEPGTTE
ncbi:hypothetical protein ACFSC4_27525 [Deinococcus malanensis]|uniref:DUF7669 domain-containing protein n=1 Tax=Deinococcus malanensis TaxID=1706855 RepID=UPI00166533FE|nr:hypothetical protein [Deinococcus malanensis]